MSPSPILEVDDDPKILSFMRRGLSFFCELWRTLSRLRTALANITGE